MTQTETPNVPSTQSEDQLGLKSLLAKDNFKARFNEVLGPRRGAQYISSIITVANASKALRQCDPKTVIAAGAQAAALDLSIVPTIGQAAMVPYRNKGRYEAQFQIMTRGIIQLAHRTGKYKKLNLAEVYEGQLIEHNEFTGEVRLDASKKISNKVQGFYFLWELVNGFRREAYWSAFKCVRHGYRYSKSFRLYGNGLWMEDRLIPKKKGKFDPDAFKGFVTEGSGTFAMCSKTIVKNDLTKWGPLSTDMQDAFTADQAVIGPDGKPEYVDTTAETVEEKDIPDPQPAAKKASKPKGNGEGGPKDAVFEPRKITKTEVNGQPCHRIWASEEGPRYIAWQESVANVARTAKESGAKVKVFYEEGKHGPEIEMIEPAK